MKPTRTNSSAIVFAWLPVTLVDGRRFWLKKVRCWNAGTYRSPRYRYYEVRK